MEIVKIPQLYNNAALNIALDTIDKKKQALVFTNTKRSAEKTAEEIALKVKKTDDALIELSEKILRALPRPTRQCQRLALCVKHGSAFHHAGLTAKQRELIEDNFRIGVIKIIACTPTLAFGLDLPAYRSIIRDLKRFGRRGMQYIPVLEYLQMAGRAGRPRFDKVGEAIIISSSEAEKQKLAEIYINGKPEDIYSKLAVEPVLRTYLLSLISSGFVRTKKQIIDFFSKTFWAHQYKDMPMLENIISKMLCLLEEFEFLMSSKKPEEEFISADDIEDISYRPTRLGMRVSELYLDPLTAHNIMNALRRASQKILVPFSFLQMVSFTAELRPLLRVKLREYDGILEEYAKFEGNVLTCEPTAFDHEYDEFFNSVKTALFFNEWIEEKDEEELFEKYDIRPGEIRMKLDIADWLLYSAVEISKLMEFSQTAKEMLKVRTRMKYGVKEELLPLLKLRQIGRIRARALFRNSYRDLGALRRAPIASLEQAVKSRKIAESIKEQLGEKIEKVSKRKRKGQKSIDAF